MVGLYIGIEPLNVKYAAGFVLSVLIFIKKQGHIHTEGKHESHLASSNHDDHIIIGLRV